MYEEQIELTPAVLQRMRMAKVFKDYVGSYIMLLAILPYFIVVQGDQRHRLLERRTLPGGLR